LREEIAFGKMNKKGMGVLLGIMVFFFVFIVATMMTQPMNTFIDNMRDDLNCSVEGETLTVGERMTCLVGDLILPFFIAIVIVGGAAWLFPKTSI